MYCIVLHRYFVYFAKLLLLIIFWIRMRRRTQRWNKTLSLKNCKIGIYVRTREVNMNSISSSRYVSISCTRGSQLALIVWDWRLHRSLTTHWEGRGNGSWNENISFKL